MKETKKKKHKKFINFFIIGTIVGIMIWIGVQENQDNQIKSQERNHIDYTTRKTKHSWSRTTRKARGKWKRTAKRRKQNNDENNRKLSQRRNSKRIQRL